MENEALDSTVAPLNLTQLATGEEGMVVSVTDAQLQQALARVGFIQGDRFLVAQVAPWGGPVALKVRGGKVAMRQSDALHVLVKRI